MWDLSQIQNYATIILNFGSFEFNFSTFYGYLIGENIEPNDVRAHDPDFLISSKFDFLYRPSKKVAHFSGKTDGNIYYEVIKFSNLLKRAKVRNQIFLSKLGFQREPKKSEENHSSPTRNSTE
jgi:hypothetical protein